MITQHCDVLIIGSGASGLCLALSLADHARVIILSKDELLASASQRAQGGIAAVMNQDDSFAKHIEDTINVGDGLCDPKVVEFTVTRAKAAIQWLIKQGVQFTTNLRSNTNDPLSNRSNSPSFHLTKEGGHSCCRILHVADKTGAAVVKTLAEQVLHHPNIDCFSEKFVIDLICHQGRCLGSYVLDNLTGKVDSIMARYTVLATGGASRVYRHTSHAGRTTGDGIAMAWRAGARVANLEFNQFHPTCLYHPKVDSFLITEAVRGEGGVLLLPNGDRFMPEYDKRCELAPRDIVARAIAENMKKKDIPCVYCDISHRSEEFIKHSFPTIYQYCLSVGLDITKSPIPVVPAAHYTCGGVMTDLNGQTDIANLYAIGETSYSGLHGANRIASNSLLECLVFAASAGSAIKKSLSVWSSANKDHVSFPTAPPLNNCGKKHFSKMRNKTLTHELWDTMWRSVSIVRHEAELKKAQQKIATLQKIIVQCFSTSKPSKALLELRNMILVSSLMIKSAVLRKESRGLHYREDYPGKHTKASNTILKNNR